MPESMRIQRALARAGVASRRHSEVLVAAGRVTVNGRVARIGQSVRPDQDEIRVDGEWVTAPATAVWIVLHKPAGVMTTRTDPQGRQTVFDLVRRVPGLTYIGRLDYRTEGVLLLTTDGVAAHRLAHPRFGIEREYRATVRGDAPAAAERLRGGLVLADGPVRPAAVLVRPASGGRHELRLTLTEGRTREVRRLCAALGLVVERLIRTRYGPVELGRLAAGKSRPLTAGEWAALTRLLSAVTLSPGVGNS